MEIRFNDGNLITINCVEKRNSYLLEKLHPWFSFSDEIIAGKEIVFGESKYERDLSDLRILFGI